MVGRYYQAYVAFFTRLLLEERKPVQAVLEAYVFARDANVGAHGARPLMASRFCGGFLHPLIHVGYGAEFGLPGMLVEGTSSDAPAAHGADAAC